MRSDDAKAVAEFIARMTEYLEDARRIQAELTKVDRRNAEIHNALIAFAKEAHDENDRLERRLKAWVKRRG